MAARWTGSIFVIIHIYAVPLVLDLSLCALLFIVLVASVVRPCRVVFGSDILNTLALASIAEGSECMPWMFISVTLNKSRFKYLLKPISLASLWVILACHCSSDNWNSFTDWNWSYFWQVCEMLECMIREVDVKLWPCSQLKHYMLQLRLLVLSWLSWIAACFVARVIYDWFKCLFSMTNSHCLCIIIVFVVVHVILNLTFTKVLIVMWKHAASSVTGWL